MRSSRGQQHIKLDYSLNPHGSIIENLCLSDKLLILYRNYAKFNHAKTRQNPFEAFLNHFLSHLTVKS